MNFWETLKIFFLEKSWKNKRRTLRNPGFDRPQDGSKPLTVDEDVELPQPPLEGVQCQRSSHHHSATDAGSQQQDEQLVAFIVAAELTAKR